MKVIVSFRKYLLYNRFMQEEYIRVVIVSFRKYLLYNVKIQNSVRLWGSDIFFIVKLK